MEFENEGPKYGFQTWNLKNQALSRVFSVGSLMLYTDLPEGHEILRVAVEEECTANVIKDKPAVDTHPYNQHT